MSLNLFMYLRYKRLMAQLVSCASCGGNLDHILRLQLMLVCSFVWNVMVFRGRAFLSGASRESLRSSRTSAHNVAGYRERHCRSRSHALRLFVLQGEDTHLNPDLSRTVTDQRLRERGGDRHPAFRLGIRLDGWTSSEKFAINIDNCQASPRFRRTKLTLRTLCQGARKCRSSKRIRCLVNGRNVNVSAFGVFGGNSRIEKPGKKCR